MLRLSAPPKCLRATAERHAAIWPISLSIAAGRTRRAGERESPLP